MTLLGWVILIAGSIAFAAVAQLLIRAEELPYRWVATAIAAFVGAYVTSEGFYQGYTPEVEGFALLPAIAGGLVVGLIVDQLIHYLAGQHTGAVNRLD